MINAAQEGTTVYIPADTFNESLIVTKNITLKGVSRGSSILQPGAGGERVISVIAGKSLTLETLQVSGAKYDGDGGGVFLEEGSLTVTSCIISNNSATNGGGDYQTGEGRLVTITSSIITGNTALMDGGGLYAQGQAILNDSQFMLNTTARHGGGLYVIGSAQLSHSAIFVNQATTGSGGGVSVNSGFNILATQFVNNTAGSSGGGLAQLDAGQTLSMIGATFNNNTSKVYGGGAYITSYLTITNSSFTSNSVNSGGTGDVYGGGLFSASGLNGSGLTFTTNQVNCSGCYNKSGGGLFVTKDSSVTLSTFDQNSAWTGGGIHSTLNSDVTLTLTHSIIKNHDSGCWGSMFTCAAGGGVYAYTVKGGNILFENNRVDGGGGGIIAHHVELTNSRFICNSASGGGGLFVFQSFSGDNLLFAHNIAGYGAAFAGSGPTTLRHATFAKPTRGEGSAIRVNNGTLTVTNSIISGYSVGIHIGGTLNENYNLFWDNGTHIDTPGGPLSLVASSLFDMDPLFVNPAVRDYHLRGDSPAIGNGTNLGIPIDLDGRARINRWDIGTYQFWGSLRLPLIMK